MRLSIKTRQKWQEVRQRGHRRWIVQGVLRFGVPLAIGVGLTQYLVARFFRGSGVERDWAFDFFVLILMAIVGGYWVADVLWHKAEERFD